MRYGAQVFNFHSPEQWVAAHEEKGYGAAYFPWSYKDDSSLIDEYAAAAHEAGLVIAEVGAWSNPISPNKAERDRAIELNIRQLQLADRIKAECCVNISGSRHPEIWMAAHPDNLTEKTFELIVKTVQRIIDQAKPTYTKYSLECMPWCFPDSVDSYLQLYRAIDRKGFGVHLDPCNLVNSPRLFYGFDELMKQCVGVLGSYTRSCHVKDLYLVPDGANVELKEVLLGTGGLPIASMLKHMANSNVPMMLEHLPDEQSYDKAAAYFEQTAAQLEIEIERL